jgi:hypothetical protein
MPRFSVFTALCGSAALVILTGCSSNSVTSPSALSGAGVTEFSSVGSTRASLSHYNDPLATGTGGNPEISCPSQAPRIFHGGVLELRLELQWQPVFNVKRYQVEVEKRTFSGYVPFVTENVTDGVYYEVYGVEGGQYRLRVRSIVCGNEGSWSEYVYLSIDGLLDLGGPGGGGEEPGDSTTTYWVTDQGTDGSRKSGCENLGQGSIGTYLDLGINVCKIVTEPGGEVLGPQPFWDQYFGALPD